VVDVFAAAFLLAHLALLAVRIASGNALAMHGDTRALATAGAALSAKSVILGAALTIFQIAIAVLAA